MKRQKPSGNGTHCGPMDAFLKIARKDPQSMYQTIPITGNTLI